jgi:hypothetical protein
LDGLGDDASALRDHNEAVRRIPPVGLPSILDNRADFHARTGQHGLARADRARAKEFRQKQSSK